VTAVAGDFLRGDLAVAVRVQLLEFAVHHLEIIGSRDGLGHRLLHQQQRGRRNP
jgi:hypothetical protein